jgi:hypothetical protein
MALALDSNAVLPEPARQKMEALQAQIDAALVPWLTKRYAGLANLPPAPPVMLHHITRFLSRYVNDAKHHKAAFVLAGNDKATIDDSLQDLLQNRVSVAAHTGRLLRLQGTAAAAHVQRRVKEDYGERETASRAARRVLRSFIDWGVLKETGDKGVYGQGDQFSVEDPRLIAWMVEASLRARVNGSTAIKDLLDSPSIFPFRLAHVSAEHVASLSPRLNILRHGLDDDLVMLREKGGVT